MSTNANSLLLCEELDMPHNSVLLRSYQHWSQASELSYCKSPTLICIHRNMRFYNECRQTLCSCVEKNKSYRNTAQEQPCAFSDVWLRSSWLWDIKTQPYPAEHGLTVSAVIPGNKRRRPTLRFICVLTLNFAVVFALHTVSQFTAVREDNNNHLEDNWRQRSNEQKQGTTAFLFGLYFLFLFEKLGEQDLVTFDINFSVG